MDFPFFERNFTLFGRNGLTFSDDDLPVEDDLPQEDDLPLEDELTPSPDDSQSLEAESDTGPSLFGTLGSATGAAINMGFSFLSQAVKDGYEVLAPPPLKKAVELTGSIAKVTANAGLQGAICLGELVDFDDFGGTKSPLPSIAKNYNRLLKHDADFAKCVNMLAYQGSEYYLYNAEDIKKKVSDAIRKGYDNEGGSNLSSLTLMKGAIFNGAADIADWFLGLSEELIAQTIKANILHIAANLADQGFDPNHSFADQSNPFGRLFSVIGKCLNDYEIRLQDVSKLPEEDRDEAYRKIFVELSSALLAKLFPKGADDIQLFHPTIPCINFLKGLVWDKMNQELPNFLYRAYQETQPISDFCPNWKEQFDVDACGLKADQLINLPSTLFNHLIKKDGAKSLDDQARVLAKILMENGLGENEAKVHSLLLIKYAKDFLLTNDPNLQKMGSFLERYVMEHLLFNMSQFLPDNVDDVPLPLYIIQHWLEGNVFKKLRSLWDGSQLSPKENEKAARELLAPFGLDNCESFPLPDFIKEKNWPKIEDFLIHKLPDMMLKGIPEWMALKKRAKNQGKLNNLLDDQSLPNAVTYMADSLTDKLFHSLQSQFVLSKKMAALCPSMTKDQQDELDKQWQALFDENDSLKILKGFGNQCLEAFAFQICKDLYKNYQEASWIAMGQELFISPGEEESSPSSFAAWLLSEITQACQLLEIEGVTEDELKSLKRSIQLKNALHDPKDPAQAKIDQAELDLLWPTIQPKFNHITQHLLGVLGYKKASMLPLPEPLKPVLWKVLTESLPHIFFNQFGDLMLPLLEKESLEKQVKAMPEGAFIRKGCQLLSRDVVKHLPEWLEKSVETLPGKAIDEHAEYGLSDKAETYFVETLKDMLKGNDAAYGSVWKFVESYMEGLLLKIVVRVGKMDQKDFQTLRVFAEKAKDDLLALQKKDDKDIISDEEVVDDAELSDAEKILIQFSDKLFAWLGIETSKDLFGIPLPLQELALKGMKAKLAKGLLGIYQLDNKIRNHVVKASPVEEHLPTSAVAQAVLALTRFAMDKATDDLTASSDGKLEVISQIYNPVNLWLDKQDGKDFALVDLFKDVIHQEVLNPWIGNLFKMLDAGSIQPYKQSLADWINPILTDQIISHLAPLLEKEKEGQADFDQAFLMALLPVFMRHIKHISKTTQSFKEFNFENFVSIAGDELHPGVPLKTGSKKKTDLEGERKFYKKQAKLIFNLIFPNGKDDLIKILPDLDVSDKQLDLLMKSAEDLLAEHVPKAIHQLFNRESLVTVFKAFFETLIENLDKPIKIKSEKKSFSKEDEQIGSIVIEAARLLDLPVKFFEKFPGVKSMEKKTAGSIGAAIRAQFDGNLLTKTIEGILPKLADKKHVKVPKVNMTQAEKLEAKKQAEIELKALKRKVIQKSLKFVVRYIAASFDHATNISKNPVFQFFRKGLLTICSFVFIKLIGSTLHFLKIDRFILNRLYDILEKNQERILTLLAQPEIHKDVIYHGIEAFEGVHMGKATK